MSHKDTPDHRHHPKPVSPEAKPVFDQRDKDLAHRDSPDQATNPSNDRTTDPNDASVAVGSTVLYRDAPETQGGPTRAVVTDSEVEAHERRGWYKRP